MDPSAQINKKISDLSDWRGELLTSIRKLIHKIDPEIGEEWKWSSPLWVKKGNVCSYGVFKDHVKLNFFQGASLQDKHNLFNAGLEAKKTRGIDFKKGSKVNEPALMDLLKEAIEYNQSS